jgi:hypothetical protein
MSTPATNLKTALGSLQPLPCYRQKKKTDGFFGNDKESSHSATRF